MGSIVRVAGAARARVRVRVARDNDRPKAPHQTAAPNRRTKRPHQTAAPNRRTKPPHQTAARVDSCPRAREANRIYHVIGRFLPAPFSSLVLRVCLSANRIAGDATRFLSLAPGDLRSGTLVRTRFFILSLTLSHSLSLSLSLSLSIPSFHFFSFPGHLCIVYRLCIDD
jgi:hypothetical protein